MTSKNENSKNKTRQNTAPDSNNKQLVHSRRRVLSTVAAGVGTAALAGCLGGGGENGEPTASSPLRVEFFGGIFKEILDEELVDPFHEETGIPIESEAGLSQYELTRLNSAVQAGEAPVDLFVAQPRARMRGQDMELWHTHDPSAIPSYEDVLPELRPETDDGELIAVGAFGVYESLVTNLDAIDEPLTSWHALWDDQYEDQLAMQDSFDSHLLDITAHIFDEFDGRETLETESGIMDVLEKIQEIRSQVTMWFDAEAEAQEGMETNDVGGAKFFNDVGVVMENEDEDKYYNAVPEEGLVENHAAWVIPRSSSYTDAAAEFIEYTLQPDVQKRITENLFTAPVLQNDVLDISDELYSAVHGPGPDEAIRPNYQMYIDREEWLDEQWRDMILP